MTGRPIGKQSRRALGIVLFVIALTTLLRLYLALHFFGFQGGDDTEIAEEALRRVVHMDYDPWEIRNLFVSDVVVAPFVKLATWLGITFWPVLAAITRLPFVALSALNIYLVYEIGRRWFDENASVIAAALYSLHWIPLVYGSSQYPRTVSVTCVLCAVLLIERPSSWRALAAGVLIAAATATRYSEAIYLGTIALLAWEHRPKRLIRLVAICAGFAAGALLLMGLYEQATWGRPFAAVIAFARFTLIERASSSIGKHQPIWWYVTGLPLWITPALWPFFAKLTPANVRRIVATVVLPVVVLSVIHHKELRYLQVVIAFTSLFAAAGASVWLQSRRALAATLLALAIPFQLYRVGIVRKRSMNAVRAAQWLSARHVKTVALSQVWAYGGRMYLGNSVRVRDVGMPPTKSDMAQAVLSAECIAMYADDAPAYASLLAAHGFKPVVRFEGGRSAPCVIYCR